MRESSATPFGYGSPVSTARIFASVLDTFYKELLEQGIPDDLAKLVRQLGGVSAWRRKLAIVLQRDAKDCEAAAALLAETGLDVVCCDTVEEAVQSLALRADETAFVFADQTNVASDDGIALATTAATLWPGLRVVVTLDQSEPSAILPKAVVTMRKPWRGLDVMVQAERALSPTDLGDVL